MKSNDWQIDWSLDEYGILSKLLFAESSVRVSEGILRTLGFVHLYTASGIHLYAFLDFIEKGARGVTRWSGSRTYEAKRLGLVLGLIVLAYLWSLQSFRVGFARPILIFLIRMWAREKGFRWRLFYPLTITFVLDWILKIESGRLHYYLAVGGGLLGLDWAKQKGWGGVAEHAAMALGSWVWTAIVDLICFHQVSWMTPVWSLITIPVTSLFLYPITLLSLVATHSIPDWIFELWNRMMEICVSIVDSGFTFSIVNPTSVWISALLGGIATLTVWKVRDRRGVATVILLLAMFAGALRLDDSRVVQLDVGQGDSLLAIRDDRVEMVDVGSARALSSQRWLQKLSIHGVNHVDTLLLSHLDEDHVGGLMNLVAFLPISVIQTHSHFWRSEKGQRLVKRLREKNQAIQFSGENQLQLMQLAWFSSDAKRRDGNSFMAGVLLPIDEHRVYLALGDGDDSQEAKYERHFSKEISRYSNRIWKAGHHGSRYSSGMNELKELSPSVIWISVGKKNRYHHPSVEAMSRFQTLGVRFQRTDEDGDLVEKISQLSWARTL